MQKGKRAFESLNIDDQKSLIDLNAAIAVIIARLPDMLPPIRIVVEAFAAHTGRSANLINFAMQDIWDALLDQDWEFRVTKKGLELITQFIPTRTGDGGNGGTVQESANDDRS